MKALVIQKGTREYFLAARAFHRKGFLVQMVVDWYTPFEGWLASALRNSRSSTLSKAFGASSSELPRELVRPMYALGIFIRLYNRYLIGTRQDWAAHAKTDLLFAKRVAQIQFPPHDVFFTYSYSGLEALISEKARGVFTILDQIDPGVEERAIIKKEEKIWPAYVTDPVPDFARSHERNAKEWDIADLIIVNSEWSKNCIVKRGCDSAKVEVLPLAYEKQVDKLHPERETPPPLKVLWLGRVTLQKGIQYLIKAAKLLINEPVEFHVAGTIGISKDALSHATSNIFWLGNVSIKRKAQLYQSCHVFVLPTLSDGFAITQLEAFANAMPVVTTARCGDVVDDGETGFLVAPANPESLAEALAHFLRQPELAKQMGERCVQVVRKYSVDAYASRLVEIISRRMAHPAKSDRIPRIQ